MPKPTMRILWLLVLILLALEGASAQRVQPVPRDQKPKPAASPSLASKFFEAVKNDDEDQALKLLQGDPLLANVKDENGWTPLHVAVISNQEKILELLLAKGADSAIKTTAKMKPISRMNVTVRGPWSVVRDDFRSTANNGPRTTGYRHN